VYSEYTSQRVLTLSFMRGRHLADVPRTELDASDTQAIGRDLLSAYMKQIAVDGVFHCDPHPGNMLLTDDGRLVADGFWHGRPVRRLGRRTRCWCSCSRFRATGRDAWPNVPGHDQPPGRRLDRHGAPDICGLVSRYHDMSGGRMGLGTALLDLTRLAYTNRARCRRR
jgi:hypothetical protein